MKQFIAFIITVPFAFFFCFWPLLVAIYLMTVGNVAQVIGLIIVQFIWWHIVSTVAELAIKSIKKEEQDAKQKSESVK